MEGLGLDVNPQERLRQYRQVFAMKWDSRYQRWIPIPLDDKMKEEWETFKALTEKPEDPKDQ